MSFYTAVVMQDAVPTVVAIGSSKGETVELINDYLKRTTGVTLIDREVKLIEIQCERSRKESSALRWPVNSAYVAGQQFFIQAH